MKRLITIFLGVFITIITTWLSAAKVPFSWDNATVYFVITDRFYNGDPTNDNAYGRQKDGVDEIGTFHGGDLKGLTLKLQEGYFTDLGVNAIWITAPYQQILGWVAGGNKAFKHYGYHGYYALDYTIMDANMGTEEELREFIDTAHSLGIRVIFDIVMNHPGYGDAVTLDRYKVEVLWDGWEQATLKDYYSFFNFNDPDWRAWWDRDWVRTDLPGYKRGGTDERTKQLAYLPDFRTESREAATLPPFYAHKTDTRAESIDGFTVRQYLIKWLTDWIRKYGVDGFRCDTAKHVERDAWRDLKQEATKALRDWKREHPEKKLDDLDFWMTGEVWGQGVERNDYFDSGFDSLLNFDFQEFADKPEQLEQTFSTYAQKINIDPSFNLLSYISSHDTHLFSRKSLIEAGTALLLLPGGVQIFYGDETARPAGVAPAGDEQQATRSDMNWGSIDKVVLTHWQKLGRFRNRHLAIGAGSHRMISKQPYIFSREHHRQGHKDQIIVVMGASGSQKVDVSSIFPNGTRVWDYYTGHKASVSNGLVTLTAHENGVMLVEEIR